MNHGKIDAAVERLENNLPIRQRQSRMPQPLRQLHQSILRFFLEHGRAPGVGDIESGMDWNEAVELLAQARIIVTDENGGINGAYPFVETSRDFRVLSRYGAANAMCAFDALAISSMFGLPTRIESRCRVSGGNIVIEQDDNALYVLEPEAPVFGAIDWGARDGSKSCSNTLCMEMMFITGRDNAAQWQAASPETRELFELDQAHAFICAVFVPLMQAQPALARAG